MATFSAINLRMTLPILLSRNALPYQAMHFSTVFVKALFPLKRV